MALARERRTGTRPPDEGPVRELVVEGVFRPVSNGRSCGALRPAARAAAGRRARQRRRRARWQPSPRAEGAARRGGAPPAEDVLDNADGQLARATGRVTLLGRYLDTEADLVVNAGALRRARLCDRRAVARARAFVALTVVLSVDFNASGAPPRTHRDASVAAAPYREPSRARARAHLRRRARAPGPRLRVAPRLGVSGEAVRRRPRSVTTSRTTTAHDAVSPYSGSRARRARASSGSPSPGRPRGCCLRADGARVAAMPPREARLTRVAASLTGIEVLQGVRPLRRRRVASGAGRSSTRPRPSRGRRSPLRSPPRA